MVDKTTRFIATVDDVDREIFSVTERKNGELQFLLSDLEAPKGRKKANLTSRDRLSVRSDPTSSGMLFKQQYRLEDNIRRAVSAFVLPGPEGLLWPAFMYAPPDPRLPGYECAPKRGDIVVSVTRYDPRGVKLIVCPIIAGKDVPDLTFQGFHTQRHYFTAFDVIVARVFMVATTYAFGEKAFFISSANKADESVPSWGAGEGVVSYGSVELAKQMDTGIYSIRDQYLRQVREHFDLDEKKDGALLREMERVTDHFGINPPPIV